MRRLILLLLVVPALGGVAQAADTQVVADATRAADARVTVTRTPEGRLVLSNRPATNVPPTSRTPSAASPGGMPSGGSPAANADIRLASTRPPAAVPAAILPSVARAATGGATLDRSWIDGLVERYATDHRLDPMLVRALIQVESAYDAAAVSHKGAIGLMQLMPETAADLSVHDPFDPESNVRGGTAYLRRMLDEFDDQLPLALAGYNAGPGAVVRHGGVPPYQETQQYVRKVLRLYTGEEPGELPTLSAAGGASATGRQTFLIRRDGRLLMTTSPPQRR